MADIYIILAYILSYIGLFAAVFYAISLFTHYKKGKEPEPKEDKKVSILIPAYNEEETIVKTIKSALSLNYPKEKLEIIVIDDGSKDKTYEIAMAVASKEKRVKVFRKKNGGKGTALNFGIKKARGEIIVSMDADTTVDRDSLRRMVGFFYNDDVMLVSPSMGVINPRSIWQRIQQIEYYMGVFLRKSFATINAIHVTPGAFSAYRKEYFDKHGGYEEDNLTEDLELALRIQSHGYIIENAPKSCAYTKGPKGFRELLIQRRRWYAGLIKNLWAYRRLFGFKHGALGTVVLPVAVVTVFLSVFLTSYVISRALSELWKELLSLQSINFQFKDAYELNSYLFENFFLLLTTQPIILISGVFILFLGMYVYFSKSQMRYKESISFGFVLFVTLYSFVFTIWWLVSVIYVAFNREVKWR
ncbi:hypothetical protein CMI45_00505 [Candidatus Pacearchaeota archaeon]|nr:hypothetical protein [Candidatus Pacearchaeota archaeon]|tara:strand:- start:6656 stop:7903 length:1248 start_codon:yes stop_codon:yes gene_type:complete